MSRPTELKGFEPKNEGEYMYKEAYGFLANDNPVMGRHFLGKAYELGNFAAGNDLAYGLCHGWFGERDYDTATKIYRKLARKGDPDAMNNYAFCYLLGTGVKKNLRLAESWMWKAIWKGNIHAAASYAQLVLENTFSKISKNLGMWLCFWAADNGESGAMNDLGLEYLAARGFSPGGEAHVLFLCIGAFNNEFSGRVTVDGIVHLVLDFLEKDAGGRSIGVIVNGRGVDVRNLLIEAALAQADFPDFFQEMFKVIDIQEGAVFHPLFVYDVAAYGKLAEYICTPLSELSGSHRINTVSDRDYSIQIVVFYLVIFAVCGSLSEFPTN